MKQKTSFSAAWLQKLSMLLAALFAFSSSIFAQANYWSVFGTSGCSNSNVMNATVSPPTSASFTSMNSINDFDHIPGNPYPLAYTTFNATGQPLFSVDQNGIYNSNGTQAYDFTSGYSTTITVSGTPTSITATSAVSEICVFPCTVTSANTSYYAVFWAFNTATANSFVLRAVQINISASGTLSFTDNILYDNTSNGIVQSVGVSGQQYFPVVVADAAPCGGARNIYTIDEHDEVFQGSNLRKWTFAADGTLPSPSTATFQDYQIFDVEFPKAKMLTIAGTKYIGFISSEPCATFDDCPLMFNVALWDISDPYSTTSVVADITSYLLPSTSNIFGFDHVSKTSGGTTNDYIYVSFINETGGTTANPDIDPANSGLAFFSAVTAGNTTTSFTLVTGSDNFNYTDLQADAAGDLFMVNGPLTTILSPTTITGSLAYLPRSQFGLSSGSPVTLSSSCTSGSTNYSVASLYAPGIISGFTTIGSPFTAQSPFYLGTQYPNENQTFPTITGIDINTHCAIL